MTGIPFISWMGHGAIDVAPPGIFENSTAHAFVIDADKSSTQALTDKLLNAASDGSVTYEVPLGVSIFSSVNVDRSFSGGAEVGWLPGREFAIWVPLIERHKGDILKTRAVLWSPYIFINYAMGMVIGRETWGWAKVLGDLEVASDNPAAPQFCCTTTYFPTLSSDTKGVTAPLYTIKANASHDDQSEWSNGVKAAEEFLKRLLSGAAKDIADLFHFHPHVPAVALKQFREPGATDTACYRAIVHTPVEITKFKGGGFLKGEHEIEVTTCESHQIIRDILGREPDPGSTKIPVKFGIWSSFDFATLPGDNVVVSA